MHRVSIEELLRRRIGLDPVATGPGALARATRARMDALGFAAEDGERYRSLVARSEQELQALIEEVIVPESWFFRDVRPFTLLADRAEAGWVGHLARPPLRALSVPCARGEEPYSMAIALLDKGLTPSRFRIDAVDVSRSALEAAERGVYTGNAFRSGDLSFRDRYFQLTSAGHELVPEVKQTVVFHQGNLLDPALLAGLPPFDVIFCRNLLIYLDAEARLAALANLDRLLSPTGLLVAGHAEHLAALSTRFRPTGDRRFFAFERAPEPSGAEPAPPAARPHTTVKRAPGRPSTPRPSRARGHPPSKSSPSTDAREHPRHPRRRPDDDQPQSPGPTPLEQAARLADQGRHGEAVALCEEEIRRVGPSAPAFFLLGVVLQAAGDRERAERCFEKTVYLAPRHEDALLALSLLAQRRGDLAAAAAYRRRAERAYQEKNPQ
jgi:chemotaxis protein methyltransferase WspC